MDYIIEPQRKTEIYGSYDVVVCGGGIAGVAAALASARSGAKTLVLESTYMLGGLATAGLVAIYLPLCDGEGHQLSFGVAEELLRLSVQYGGEYSGIKPKADAWLCNGTDEEKRACRFQTQYNPHVFAILMEGLLEREGVDILYGAFVAGVEKAEGDRISSVIFETRAGRYAVRGESFIDCTGDATLFRLAGLLTTVFSLGNAFSWWYMELDGGKNNLRLRGARDIDSVNGKYTHAIDGLDARELSTMTISAHRNILNDFLMRGEATNAHAITTLPTIPQVRMTRRINGAYTMTKADDRKYFGDSVGMFADWTTKGLAFELPFSALYDKGIKNLFSAGRCISADEKMWEITRVIPVCAVSGEAVGTAAARFRDYDKVEISALQKELENRKVIVHLDRVGVKYR